MNTSDSGQWDWKRFLIGDVPPDFLLEVAMRMCVVYLILMVCMRLLGKRMAAQLTRNELAAMTSLAAGVGLPVVAPERGMLPAILICVIVVIASRLISKISSRDQKIESLTQGEISTLVIDGVMNTGTLEKTGITRERVLSEVRSTQIQHLGQVKRLFFEANGSFTVIKSKQPVAGLCAIPESDESFIQELKIDDNRIVCHICGAPNDSGNKSSKCQNCGHVQWTHAVMSAE